MTVLDEVAAERSRQIEIEGWTIGHDDEHVPGDLARAGAAYAAAAGLRCATEDGAAVDTSRHVCPDLAWPFSKAWWKPKTVRRDLIRAAALIVAEIERLDRAPDAEARRFAWTSAGDGSR